MALWCDTQKPTNQKIALWCDTQNSSTQISIMVWHLKPTNRNTNSKYKGTNGI